MIELEFYIYRNGTKSLYDLYFKDLVSYDYVCPTNMDEFRYLVAKYLTHNKSELRDIEYTLQVYNTNNNIIVCVFFEYNLSISRDIKINKILKIEA